MRKIMAWTVLIVLLLAGCGGNGGAQSTPTETASATPDSTETQTATPSATATQSVGTGAPAQDATALSIIFINVGYGDAALIQAAGKAYLVDTGAKGAFASVYRALALRGVERLDGVFLTHTHADHVGGMEAVAQRYDIGTLYSASISMDKKNGDNVIDELAKDLQLAHVKLNAGDMVNIAGDVYFEVLGPLEYNGDDDNDNSLVMKLHTGGVTVLLTGDMQFAEEQTLLSAGVDVAADVLKVGNHGNPDATSEAFANAVGAGCAVISTSTEEDDDTPNARVIDALGSAQIAVTQDYGSGVLLTAKDGEVTIAAVDAPAKEADIAIAGINRDTQTVTLVNKGGDVDISGYFLYSDKGSEVFVFPQGAVMAAGQTLTVSCLGNPGDYIWPEEKVWKKDDPGALYDRYGNVLSRLG